MRSIRTRLGLLVFAIAVASIGFVYVLAVPGLRSSLVQEKLQNLRATAMAVTPTFEHLIGSGTTVRTIDRLVRSEADAAGARVTLFYVSRGSFGVQAYATSDSTAEVRLGDLRFRVTQRVARTGRPAMGTESGPSGQVGEAAVPLFQLSGKSHRRIVDQVLVYSAPLADAEGNVSVVRRRILQGGVLALLLALVAGAAIAGALSRRIRRMETAAGRVAAGDFSERFVIDRDDELGSLARTLDDMRRQLAALDTARKSFIATASHELRTPIFSLGGFLELLQDEELDAETRDRFLGQVRVQVDRLGKLATDLLDLSRLEAGSLELRPEPTDLADLARAVADEFEVALAAHDSHLELRLPQASIDADVDPSRVAQVIRILLSNALTHTPPGTDVVVGASLRDGHVRMGVADFGPGISESMLPRIFEPFQTTDDAQGSGLGLAIAFELAERMQGSLTVESEPGRTAFTLELPRRLAAPSYPR